MTIIAVISVYPASLRDFCSLISGVRSLHAESNRAFHGRKFTARRSDSDPVGSPTFVSEFDVIVVDSFMPGPSCGESADRVTVAVLIRVDVVLRFRLALHRSISRISEGDVGVISFPLLPGTSISDNLAIVVNPQVRDLNPWRDWVDSEGYSGAVIALTQLRFLPFVIHTAPVGPISCVSESEAITHILRFGGSNPQITRVQSIVSAVVSGIHIVSETGAFEHVAVSLIVSCAIRTHNRVFRDRASVSHHLTSVGLEVEIGGDDVGLPGYDIERHALTVVGFICLRKPTFGINTALIDSVSRVSQFPFTPDDLAVRQSQRDFACL